MKNLLRDYRGFFTWCHIVVLSQTNR
jgi:hypothetical protein